MSLTQEPFSALSGCVATISAEGVAKALQFAFPLPPEPCQRWAVLAPCQVEHLPQTTTLARSSCSSPSWVRAYHPRPPNSSISSCPSKRFFASQAVERSHVSAMEVVQVAQRMKAGWKIDWIACRMIQTPEAVSWSIAKTTVVNHSFEPRMCKPCAVLDCGSS